MTETFGETFGDNVTLFLKFLCDMREPQGTFLPLLSLVFAALLQVIMVAEFLLLLLLTSVTGKSFFLPRRAAATRRRIGEQERKC